MGSNCLCLPRSQCLHLSNRDKFIKLSTLPRALSASTETLDLQVFYTLGEAIGGLGKISVRDVLNLMAKCHFYLYMYLKIHLLLHTHEANPCLTGKLLRFTLCPQLLSPYVFRVFSRLLSFLSQLILINKQGSWCSHHLLSLGLSFSVGIVGIQKTKIMASGPITSWQTDGETMETVTDFIFLGSKITAYGDCGHEIKRHLLLRRKAVTNLDSILKSRDSTLPTKVHLVKAVVFPVVMYGCESWTVKKAERQRINAFELWCWRRLLRVPWTARRSNQSILQEISPDYSLEGLMLKLNSNILATWYKELTH